MFERKDLSSSDMLRGAMFRVIVVLVMFGQVRSRCVLHMLAGSNESPVQQTAMKTGSHVDT